MATPGDEGNLGKACPAASVTFFSDRARCRHYPERIPRLPEVFEDRLEAGEPEEGSCR